MSAAVAIQRNLNAEVQRAPAAPRRPLQNAVQPLPEIRIKKISTFWKVISTIPFFGGISAMGIENQITKRYNRIDLNNVEAVIKMIKVENNFFKCEKLRNIFEMALIVTGIAIGIIVCGFTTFVPLLVTGVLMFLFVASLFEITNYQIRENDKKIERWNAILVERRNRQMIQNG